MINNLTSNDIANTVRQIRTLHNGAIVIAEGDKDIRVYKRFFEKDKCKYVVAFGKQNAIDAATILDGKISGVLTIIDADFDNLDSINHSSSNIVSTDTHDLETMILDSSAYKKVFDELVFEKKSKYLNIIIFYSAVLACLPLGYLRWLSSTKKDNLRLTFQKINFYKFINFTSFETNIDDMINEIKIKSPHCTVNQNIIKNRLQNIMKQACNVLNICSGHDLVEILFLGIKKKINNIKTNKLSLDIFDSMLRISYEKTDFIKSGLHQSIMFWQTKNPGFKVLE